MNSLLFVCKENSNRSQMAQAFAILHGYPEVRAYSAGSTPSGRINPKAIAAMIEVGYDLSVHESKSLEEIPNINFDAVITMGCGDECPWIPGEIHEDWEIPDPRDMNEEDFREVRDEIEAKVINLLQRI